MFITEKPLRLSEAALATTLRMMYLEKQDASINQPPKEYELSANPDTRIGKQGHRQTCTDSNQNS